MQRISSTIFFCLFLSLAAPAIDAQKLFINEFMASNSSAISDSDYQNYADWVEIYNAEQVSVNLKDYFITDDLSNPLKYKITADLIIASEGFALIWADDMNIGNHANFKLSASGESIGLYSPAFTLIDTVTFTAQQTDVSEGRFDSMAFRGRIANRK
jgi:hypothetical protein